MKKLMHIIASPREEQSRTLRVSESFLRAFQETHTNWIIDELNLAKDDLPSMNVKRVDGKYMLLQGKELFGGPKAAWSEILQHIERFLTADLYLISTPMWNFNIPYMLKHYIDIIVQPKYLFRYTESGTVEGLVKNKQMVIISSRGGDYTGKMKEFDFQEPYLRAIFGFVGLTNISYIKAEPMDTGKELQAQKIQQAQKEAEALGRKIAL